jgi:hypothetical protein
MKRISLSLLIIMTPLLIYAQGILWGDEVPEGWNGQWPEEYLITPEKTNYERTSSFHDILEFVDILRWNSEYVHIENMFTTPRGRSGFAAVLANPRVTSPEEARESGKPVIYLQGDIHPPEAEGKEALLMLMRDILLGDKSYLLDNQILIICPDFNPDGTDDLQLNHGTPHLIGSGRNAQGLNLNRDAIKLESPEVNGLYNRILNRWDPVLLYDAHAMSRVKHGYAIAYATHTLPTANPVTREYVWDNLFPEVRNNIRDNFHLETFTHCMMDEDNWPPTEWSHQLGYWFLEGKFVAMAYGLRNRMTIIVETPGHPVFERRIYAQYAYACELLEYTNQHGREMLDICQEADREIVDKIKAEASTGELENFVDGEYQSYGKIELLAYRENIAEYEPGTSVIRTKPGTAEGPPEKIPGVEHIAKPAGTMTAKVPRGYILPPELGFIAEKLRTHNVKVEVANESFNVEGERFVIDSMKHIQWMRFTLTRLEGEFRKSIRKTVPAGSFIVDMAQPNANVAFYCLEPQTPDGFLGWGLLDEYLLSVGADKHSAVYPVFKYFEKVD